METRYYKVVALLDGDCTVTAMLSLPCDDAEAAAKRKLAGLGESFQLLELTPAIEEETVEERHRPVAAVPFILGFVVGKVADSLTEDWKVGYRAAKERVRFYYKRTRRQS